MALIHAAYFGTDTKYLPVVGTEKERKKVSSRLMQVSAPWQGLPLLPQLPRPKKVVAVAAAAAAAAANRRL